MHRAFTGPDAATVRAPTVPVRDARPASGRMAACSGGFRAWVAYSGLIDDNSRTRCSDFFARSSTGLLMPRLPQPIPYQGSKRALAATILAYVPRGVDCFYEPFAGSAAVTLAAAHRQLAARYVISDSLEPLAGVWRLIIDEPWMLADRYEDLWFAQLGRENDFFNHVRQQFNADRDPAKLLYLLARCVKNAVRFNLNGEFNQSPDNRRKGVHPVRMRTNILTASSLLQGRASAREADYESILDSAGPADFIYMDPPYQGTSTGRDRRYQDVLDLDRFVWNLERLNDRGVRYAVSFDGRCGDRVYGPELPARLGLTRLEIEAGRSTQATLNGRTDVTIESLYLSPSLGPIEAQPVILYAAQTRLGV